MRDATERETVKTKRDENTAAAAAAAATATATTTRARPSVGSVLCIISQGKTNAIFGLCATRPTE